MRGMLTEEITQKSEMLLGYAISKKELRLMPYLIYCLTNNQNIDPSNIDAEERAILSKWHEHGFIESPSSNLAVTKSFYDAANELIFLGYVLTTGRQLQEEVRHDG
ncbi:hypothetical protein [Neisseria elongata]|uniref:hypothetical protein n=1 Tax=Neisseria elongata TaxID=495 RepID=UPI000D31199F|nr:hypothetical protein [Neisseria elongata]